MQELLPQNKCDRIFMRFPGGKAKALTLSYDDGVEADVRLLQIMKENGLRGTFNLNSARYAPKDTGYTKENVHARMSRSKCIEVFKNSGMEIAAHGLTHPRLERLSAPACAYEVLQDRMELEKDYDRIVRGMAYPFGTYSDEVVEVLKQCGIVYARTVESTERFDVPTDWLRMPATCHHNNPRLMELAKGFAEAKIAAGPALFYLWGHSYEFDDNNNWHVIEEFAEYIGNREDIWYATNMEIYEYVTAYKQLIFSLDGKHIQNPTGVNLYFEVEGQTYTVMAGETIALD